MAEGGRDDPRLNYDKVFSPKAKRATNKAPGTRAVGSRDNKSARISNPPTPRSDSAKAPHEYAGRAHTTIKSYGWPGAGAPSKAARTGTKEPHH